MPLLLFGTAVAAYLAAIASTTKINHDAASEPQQRGPQPGYQPHYAAQRASYDPRASQGDVAREVRLEASPAGHFYANTTIDGHHAMMMVDTGATGVVIGHKLARQLGFDLRSARYETRVRTGGGIVMACRFTLPLIIVEGIPGRNIDAIVHEREMATDEICAGLIGTSFLRQVHVTTHGNTMILRP